MGDAGYDWDRKLRLSSQHCSKIGVLTLSSLVVSILTSSCKTALRFPTESICACCVTVTIKSIIYLYRVYRLVLLMEAFWVFCEVDIYIYIVKCRFNFSRHSVRVYARHTICVLGTDLHCRLCYRDKLLWRAVLKSRIFDEICFWVIKLHSHRIVCQCILCS